MKKKWPENIINTEESNDNGMKIYQKVINEKSIEIFNEENESIWRHENLAEAMTQLSLYPSISQKIAQSINEN
jgi:hypothetical protein